jgi:hypothetical protein
VQDVELGALRCIQRLLKRLLLAHHLLQAEAILLEALRSL